MPRFARNDENHMIVRVDTQRIRLAWDPALSLVPEARPPPKGCCPTTAPVGLSLIIFFHAIFPICELHFIPIWNVLAKTHQNCPQKCLYRINSNRGRHGIDAAMELMPPSTLYFLINASPKSTLLRINAAALNGTQECEIMVLSKNGIKKLLGWFELCKQLWVCLF